jgi:acetyl esterase/lipase
VLIACWAVRLSWAGDAANSTAYETIRSLVYARPGGTVLRADIYLPLGRGPFPAVLCVHGGAWVVGNRYQMARVAERLAAHGYAAVTIDYRLAPQFLFPAQLDDCRAAWEWMLSNSRTYKLDRRRLGAWGYSAGAHLVTLMALQANPVGSGKGVGSNLPIGQTNLRPVPGASHKLDLTPFPPRLRAVVAGGTPVDFRQLPADDRTLAFWLGGTRREKPQLYEAASPARFASAAAPPIFFYHGQSDSLVPIAPVKSLVHQLDALHVPTALFEVPGAGHIRAFFDTTALERAVAFLDQ